MQGRQPSQEYPISVEPADAKIIVRLDGSTLAESERALILREANLPPVYYIPRDDVAIDALRASESHTHCPYKGDASYFRARDGGAQEIAWSYEDPFDLMQMIKGHLAFYPDRVEAIEVSPLS